MRLRLSYLLRNSVVDVKTQRERLRCIEQRRHVANLPNLCNNRAILKLQRSHFSVSQIPRGVAFHGEIETTHAAGALQTAEKT